jgi:15-cis-phytoene synthase
MAVQSQGWERRLIDLAQEALETQFAAALHGIWDDDDLSAAYRACEQVTKRHSRTFMMASGLLPRAKRRGARALYAFCRVCDNLIDAPQGNDNPRDALERWRYQVLNVQSAGDDPVAVAWADTRVRYKIPWRYAEQLMAGVAQDLEKTRYRTFDELAEYCYGVASTVGLMAMHIIGFQDSRAISYAVKLGVALQLTNILRDVGEDWAKGRLYLPLDELATFDLSERSVDAGFVDDRWRALMAFQIERTRQLYSEALAGVALLDQDGRFAITAAAQFYRSILDDIVVHDYDVFHRRAYVSNWGKLAQLPAIWRLSQRLAREPVE